MTDIRLVAAVLEPAATDRWADHRAACGSEPLPGRRSVGALGGRTSARRGPRQVRGPGPLLFPCGRFFAVHFHALDANHFVGHQADKIHVLRRLAVDPLFVFDFAVFFPIFLGGTALAASTISRFMPTST